MRNFMKQSGRKQAMTNTFNRLLVNPSEYTPKGDVAYFGTVENCELCGAALDYSFKLVHFSDPDFTEEKSLHVGSDCIVNFAETYVPMIARQLMISVKKAVGKTKTAQFYLNNPHIYEEMKLVSLKLMEYKKNFGWYFMYLTEMQNFKKSHKNLIRQEYLTKPQIAKFKQLKEKIDNGSIETALMEHKAKDMSSKFLDDTDLKFLRYFEKYKDKVGVRINENTPIYSRVEKQLFTDKVKEYKNKQKKPHLRK